MIAFAGLAGPLSAKAAGLLGDSLPRVEVALVQSLRKDDDA